MKYTSAVVFPGQGSQAVGMLNAYLDKYSQVLDTVNEGSEYLGYDLNDLIQNGPEEKLNSTVYTQPALLVAGVAIWRVLQSNSDLEPKFLAGHSLGEYTALVCSQALTFSEGINLVRSRAELMQQAVEDGKGAMAAIIGLEFNDVGMICGESSSDSEIVQMANINSPGQVVLAGHKAAVEKAVNAAKEKGAKRAIIIPVSVPSHCDLMYPAAEKFSEELAKVEWKTPNIPVIHNFDVNMHNSSADICNVLQKQLYNPVRWIETIEYLVRLGVTQIVECGPGRVLSGLNKRINSDVNLVALNDPDSLGSLVC